MDFRLSVDADGKLAAAVQNRVEQFAAGLKDEIAIKGCTLHVVEARAAPAPSGSKKKAAATK